MRRRAVSKAAWRFLPILTIAYILNYLDRTSVGIAALTMNRDLGLTAYEFGWGAGLLFASYSIFEIPSNLILYRFGARRWIARIISITWEWLLQRTPFVVGPASFYIVRLLLGAAEAGFFPGITFFLAAWFPATNTARRYWHGSWSPSRYRRFSAARSPVSCCRWMVWPAWPAWQWMFIVEGLACTP